MATLNKRLIALHPNGSFTTVVFMADAMLPGETEDEFINRETLRLNQDQEFEAATKHVVTKETLQSIVNTHPQKNKRAVRCSADKKFTLDLTYKSPAQLQEEQITTIKSKLVSGTPLTQEEADSIFKT